MQHLQQNTTLQGGKYRIEQLLKQESFCITEFHLLNTHNRYLAINDSY